MARTVSITDDMDGSPNARERKFSVEDTHYLSDLTDENWKRFLEAIQPWRDHARVERRGNIRLTDEEKVRIREWADENGMTIKGRGRFPNAVIQAYFEAMSQDDDDTP